MTMHIKHFGRLQSGKDVYSFILTNSRGMTAEIINLGGIIRKLLVPGKEGDFADVCLGMATLEDVLATPGYNGAAIGRIANRTENARYRLNGREYVLEPNWKGHNLHSGSANYANRLFSFDENLLNADPAGLSSVTLSLYDRGEGGFETPLDVKITYSLSDDNTLLIAYRTFPESDCAVNLTNHCYFNLGGHNSGPVFDHEIMIAADFYTPVNESLIPTGEILSVRNTIFDLRRPVLLGDVMGGSGFPGYDHNFVLNGCGFRHVATAYHEKSGRKMETFTDLPGMQFYTTTSGGPANGKDGAAYDRFHALCLETQYFPNSANTPHFPSIFQKAGEVCETVTAYRFSVA